MDTQLTKIDKLSTPAASYNFVSSSDLEYVYQSTGRCGRVANPYRSPQERGLLSGPVPKPCYRNPFPVTDRKSGVLDDREKRARRIEYKGRMVDIVPPRMNLSDEGRDFGKRAKEWTENYQRNAKAYHRLCNRLTFCQMTEILDSIMKLKGELVFSNFN